MHYIVQYSLEAKRNFPIFQVKLKYIVALFPEFEFFSANYALIAEKIKKNAYDR